MPTLLTDKPASAPNVISVFDTQLVYDRSASNVGADWHDDAFVIEVISMPVIPLGKRSLTILGLTATWNPFLGYWISPTDPDLALFVIPAYAAPSAGVLPVSFTKYFHKSTPGPQFSAGAVDLVAALAAGHFVETNTPSEMWQYVDAAGVPYSHADFPVDIPVALAGPNIAVTSDATGYIGARFLIADYRDGDDEWVFKKVGSAWVVESTIGKATARNAPDWKIGDEQFDNHRGDANAGVPVNYKRDHIGPEFSSEPDWFKS